MSKNRKVKTYISMTDQDIKDAFSLWILENYPDIDYDKLDIEYYYNGCISNLILIKESINKDA